jgi:FkbM family methyltransferase
MDDSVCRECCRRLRCAYGGEHGVAAANYLSPGRSRTVLLRNGDSALARFGRGLLRSYTQSFPLRKGKQRLVSAAHALMAPPTWPVRARLVNSEWMDLDLTDYVQRSIYYFGCYEPENAFVFQSLLPRSKVVVDCGAHVGQYALLAARRLGDNSEVHAFEPSPRTFSALQHNVALNDFRNVVLNQAALADQSSATRDFYVADNDNQGSNSLQPTTTALHRASFVVTVMTLDEYCTKRNLLPDLIKLDVEGAELPVLRGAARTIASSHPWIILEASDENAQAFGYTLHELHDWLVSRAYRLHVIGTRRGVTPLIGNLTSYQNVLCQPPGSELPQILSQRKAT